MATLNVDLKRHRCSLLAWPPQRKAKLKDVVIRLWLMASRKSNLGLWRTSKRGDDQKAGMIVGKHKMPGVRIDKQGWIGHVQREFFHDIFVDALLVNSIFLLFTVWEDSLAGVVAERGTFNRQRSMRAGAERGMVDLQHCNWSRRESDNEMRVLVEISAGVLKMPGVSVGQSPHSGKFPVDKFPEKYAKHNK